VSEVKYYCSHCKIEITKRATSGLCRKCYGETCCAACRAYNPQWKKYPRCTACRTKGRRQVVYDARNRLAGPGHAERLAELERRVQAYLDNQEPVPLFPSIRPRDNAVPIEQPCFLQRQAQASTE